VNREKYALVNIVCSALKISTFGHSQGSSSSYTNAPSLVDIEKLIEWQKSLDGFFLVMEESVVNWSYNQQAARKYKTFCAWKHGSM